MRTIPPHRGDAPGPESTDGDAACLTVPLHTSETDDTVLGQAVDQVRKVTATGAPAGLTSGSPARPERGRLHPRFSGLNGALLGITIAVVALLLLLTYRSPVLWLVPLMSVGLASEVASGVVYLLAKRAGLTVNGESASILTVLVFGVGTDYALLLISRYREELHRHTDRTRPWPPRCGAACRRSPRRRGPSASPRCACSSGG